MTPAKTGNHPFFIGWNHNDFPVAQPGKRVLQFGTQLIIVLTDIAGQGLNIHALKAAGHRSDQLKQAITENIESNHRTLVSRFRGFSYLAHITTDS